MGQLLAVGMGGFVGAIARYLMANVVQRQAGGLFPMGTFVVNMVGCLLIGLLFALIEGRQSLSPNVRLFLFIGLLGSFTTFSTLGQETLDLMRTGELRLALWNMVGSAFVGIGAVSLGRFLGKLAAL
jgi:CrcB protein